MNGDRKLVLVIEDDTPTAVMFRRVIEAYYAAETAASAHDGMERLINKSLPPVSCVVLDLHMPNGAGIELIQRFTLAVPLVPLVVVTGHPFSTEQALLSGAQEFLNKPMNSADLIHAVIRAMARHSVRSEYCPLERLKYQIDKRREELKHEAGIVDEQLAASPSPLSGRLKAAPI